jgi:hypothetical protein
MKHLAFALAFAVAAPGLAAPGLAAAAPRHARSHHAAGPSFPMKSDEYRKFAEARIERVRGVIDKKLDRHGVSADRKKAIHKIFDEAAHDVRAEVDKAAADGTVTQAEADKVKALTNGLRAKVRERLRGEKGPHAKEKVAKDDAAKKDKADAKKDKPAADAKPKVDAAKPKQAKAKPAKKPAGPTKPAKASTKKPKKPSADDGANL